MAAEKEALKRINKYFQWTSQHDVLMCREVLVAEPLPRSPERGKVWEKISNALNSIEQPKFRVSARAVRDRYSLLTTKQAQKLKEEEKATGIEVEQSELDCLLEEILEREKEGKARLELQDLEKVKKSEKEKETAELMRKQAMERMVNTTKKKCDNSADNGGKKKVRRSTSDTIDYLKEKSSKDHEFKKEEFDLRKKELELSTNKQDQAFQQQQDMFKVMMNQMQQQQQKQQNMQTMFIAQQQQQNKILMALLENKKQE